MQQKKSVMIAIPRPAYRRLRAFADAVEADAQVIMVNALQEHIDGYTRSKGEEFEGKFRKLLAKLDGEDVDVK